MRPGTPGLTRRRAGSGWVYLDSHGERVTDPEVLQRCRDLVIPPAWQDVWIAPVANGHIQAVGTDAAGRRQYLYHPAWRESRDAAKHDRVLELARRLPSARRRVTMDLSRPGMPRERALATAFRLLDLGYFRIGGEGYAAHHGSYGLATLRKEHVRIGRDGTLTFDYRAKSGQQRHLVLREEALIAPLSTLRRRRDGSAELLAYRDGRSWHDVTGAEINTYVKDLLGEQASAKDFRTWHGTALAAVELALRADAAAGSGRARARAVRESVAAVAHYLGNTPAVSRASYIDSRVIELFERGRTISPEVARRVAARAGADDAMPPDTRGAVETELLGLLD
ncbi:DNA topoisomerase IB [Georgenia sp. TF02-10]|uniref:DNA topoisomerase IB n=1 Tax=Georgenia sp. TF02-10 TaxID=2917725 RepID=UPI001FA6F305|nr:DNA topoisomerase IB [Georgenia sp. TF02-10]UNX54025.1 DNA topoisomerase IB [Georgenia sp. TF02-10]